MKQYMAIDQYGQMFHKLRYPRKELMERIGIKHASKMYVDDKNGKAVHIGYVIGRYWLMVYEVKRFEKVQ